MLCQAFGAVTSIGCRLTRRQVVEAKAADDRSQRALLDGRKKNIVVTE